MNALLLPVSISGVIVAVVAYAYLLSRFETLEGKLLCVCVTAGLGIYVYLIVNPDIWLATMAFIIPVFLVTGAVIAWVSLGPKIAAHLEKARNEKQAAADRMERERAWEADRPAREAAARLREEQARAKAERERAEAERAEQRRLAVARQMAAMDEARRKKAEEELAREKAALRAQIARLDAEADPDDPTF